MIDILSYFNYLGKSLDKFFYLIDGKYFATSGKEDVMVKRIVICEDGLYFTDIMGTNYKYMNDGFSKVFSSLPSGYTMILDDKERWHLIYGLTNIEIGTIEKGLTEEFANKFKEGLIT